MNFDDQLILAGYGIQSDSEKGECVTRLMFATFGYYGVDDGKILFSNQYKKSCEGRF